ncbi:UNVERIFIED_CONTAM: hypothetical protein Scaly_1450400 [Sesamum calycinum]|uniref:BRO1 domain-containing protein n=1 Tax=Sesamum calycinum TaxID=2727403 RepID=A0AAW2PN07_9LAMI
MGCLLSTPRDVGGNRGRPARIGDVAVFVPGLRIPKPVDFSQSLGDYLNKNSVEQLSALRTRIVVMAGQEAPTITRTRRRTATQHGGSTLGDLLQALEDYLPVLLGLVKDGEHAILCNRKYSLSGSIKRMKQRLSYDFTFSTKTFFLFLEFRGFFSHNHHLYLQETTMYSAWYEVLSVLHLMATLSLSQANFLLLPRASTDGYQPKLSEESRRSSVDVFLKAAGTLDCAVRHVLPQLPDELRRNLPVDLAEGVLRALCLQALGQGVDIQLGLAIDSTKATLAVKRRLACEMVKYWQQAAAYYYHGLILDEGSTEKSHGMAVAALQAADEYLKESKKACESFNSSVPVSRNPPLWGTMKYLSEKIPKDTSCKVQINRDLYSHEKIMERAPTLPDFALALKPDEYQLPLVDASWNEEAINRQFTSNKPEV